MGPDRLGGGSKPGLNRLRGIGTSFHRDGPVFKKICNFMNFGCGVLWCLIMIAACCWYTRALHSGQTSLTNQNLQEEDCSQCWVTPEYPRCFDCLNDCEWHDFGDLEDDQNFFEAETWLEEEEDFQTADGANLKVQAENIDNFRVAVNIDGETFPGLIDTGSTHTFLNLKMAEILRKRGRLASFGPQLNFFVADGSRHSTSETYEVECRVHGRKRFLKLYLINNLNEMILIGMDSLKTLDILIDPATKSLIFKHEPWDPGGICATAEMQAKDPQLLPEMEEKRKHPFPSDEWAEFNKFLRVELKNFSEFPHFREGSDL